MRLSLLIALVSLSLCACTSRADVLAGLNQAYRGHRVEVFFAAHGGPAGSSPTADGGTMYRWSSPRKTIYIPAMTFTTSPGQTTTHPAYTKTLFCELQIKTAPDDHIQIIHLLQDTAGGAMFSSRFVELFGRVQDP